MVLYLEKNHKHLLFTTDHCKMEDELCCGICGELYNDSTVNWLLHSDNSSTQSRFFSNVYHIRCLLCMWWLHCFCFQLFPFLLSKYIPTVRIQSLCPTDVVIHTAGIVGNQSKWNSFYWLYTVCLKFHLDCLHKNYWQCLPLCPHCRRPIDELMKNHALLLTGDIRQLVSTGNA